MGGALDRCLGMWHNNCCKLALWQTKKTHQIMANNKEQQQNLKLNITPEVAQGTYSNLVIISHTPAEVVMDFAQMLPGSDGAVVRQRIIMNPIHAKRTLAALSDNIKKYGQQFGTIEEPRVAMGDTVPYDILGKA